MREFILWIQSTINLLSELRNEKYSSGICEIWIFASKKDSNLKYQTRCIKCFPSGIGFVMGSIEGRVAVEYFDVDAEVQRKRYLTFAQLRFQMPPPEKRRYRRNIPRQCSSLPPEIPNIRQRRLRWICFNLGWIQQKRLAIYRRYPTSVSALAFSPQGDQLAIGSSFLDEIDVQGDRYIPEPQLFVRQMADAEIKPKNMST
ncbi:Oidioi.mRNA.OKI2018_I69.chr1.g2715.t1.cds [Oikopleura dioica]|uniref:Oidioi.mRNA.OKI2018_I69.chr1.g2715.t1.cds n=1 Tax=Oikopleura dioica TaxID=34765 RepID=A0ABN7SRY1_OIKDI|nr:Oidioi.mRNA.OKI2018_I69.chr1.g2715.t1.cds [Oikopleura dioica]